MTKKPQQSNEPAKHSEQSFSDQEVIGSLTAWIANTKRAAPELRAVDSWPSIDGYITVTDETGSTKGTFQVQVKKLSDDTKRYSFPNDKFLAYCRPLASWTPILLIGVDLKNQQAFWIHMSHNFLKEIRNSKTIKFVESQIIKLGKRDFIEAWVDIIDFYSSNPEKLEEYEKTFSVLSNIANSAISKTDERFVNIHSFLDELNGYLDHTFSIVKQIFYLNAWKLGLAYFQYDDSCLTYSLYPIALNGNDAQIKIIEKALLTKMASGELGYISFSSENPIATDPKEYAKKVIYRKTSDIVKRRWLKHSGSEYLAKEFIFAFIDEFHIPMGLELKDKYSLDEIERALDEYLLLWLKFSHDLLLRKKREPEGTIMECTPDWIHGLTENERNEVAQNVEKVIQDDTFDFRIMLRREVETSLVQFWEFLNYLKQRGESEIERLYETEQHSVDHNLKMLCEHLLEAYDTVLQNNFPMLKNELSLFGKAETILISRRVKGHPDEPTDYWGNVSIYQLQANIKGDHPQAYLVTEEELAQSRKASGGPFGEITFRDQKYRIISTDLIYEGTPMLNFIYEKLKKRIDEYFKKKESSPKFDKRSEAGEVE